MSFCAADRDFDLLPTTGALPLPLNGLSWPGTQLFGPKRIEVGAEAGKRYVGITFLPS